MKIVFLAPFGIRPKGTLLARMLPLALALTRRGHELVIVAPPYTNPEDSGREELVQGIRIVNIRLDSPRGLTTLLLALRMYRAAMAERPDLVQLFKPKGYGGLAAMFLVLMRRLGFHRPPLLVDSDDWEGRGGMNDLLPYSFAERRVFAFQEHWLLARADAVTVASRELEKMAQTLAGPGKKVLYLPNGVVPTRPGNGVRVRERLGIPLQAPVILLYSRFFEFSQERLYDLFADLHGNVTGIRFLVVGAGRQGEERHLVQAARLRGFGQSLIMAGWIDPTELPDYLAAGDVALYLFDDTLINRTKCPAKLTELVNAGVAVVADSVGQLCEYLPPESGILCLPGDWRMMSRKTVELLGDAQQRKSVAAAQFTHLHDHFPWNRLAEALDELMNTLYHTSLRRSP
ncbi:MAG: glycosyltransferase family 4 protein [Desulfuromonadales bacterium]|nr:glycosyltransferase family 4 protein [Desulfuromonadales bacterium]